MAPRGLFERPMTDSDEGSKGGNRSIMVFGLVAATMLVMLIVIGVAGKNVGPNTAQLNTEFASGGRFAEPVKNYQAAMSKKLLGIRLGSQSGGFIRPCGGASFKDARSLSASGA